MTTDSDFLADTLHLIGHMGDMEIPIRRERLAGLLADMGAGAIAAQMLDIGEGDYEVPACVLEALVIVSKGRREALERDKAGPLTIDVSSRAMAEAAATGIDGIPVFDADGLRLFTIHPDKRGNYDHAHRIITDLGS